MTVIRRAPDPSLMLGLAAWAWLLFWGLQALTLWRRDLACALFAGPFLPCGPGPLAWQQPLLMALWPAALLGLAWSAHRLVRGRARPAASR